MSRINKGKKFGGNIVDVLNAQFAARTAQGKPLKGWYKAVWPYGEPFLINQKDHNRKEAVVWFPHGSKDVMSKGVEDWQNLVNADGSVIKTKYVGKVPAQGEIYRRIARFIGKNHIVFVRWSEKDEEFEFLGVYTSERQGDTLVYRRIADAIETDDWQR